MSEYYLYAADDMSEHYFYAAGDMSEYYLHTNCTFTFTKQQLIVSFMLARCVELDRHFTSRKQSVSRDGY